MPGIEREYQRYVDDLILHGSKEDLERIQAIDVDTQLSGSSFYDLYSDHDARLRPKP